MCSQASQGRTSCISFWSCRRTLTKNPTAALLKCVFHNWVWLVAKKQMRTSLQSTHYSSIPVTQRHRQADRVYSGFVFYQVSPVSSHMPKSCKFGYFVRCPGVSEWVCELTWLFIYIGAFWTFDFTVSGHQNHKQTSVFSLLTLPHSSTIFHLCLLPPPDAFEHSSLVLAFSFLVFPTIFSF